MQRLHAIVADAQPMIALTIGSILVKAENIFDQAPELKALRWAATDQMTDDLSELWRMPRKSSEMLAFLQYTSGSTADPKGVMVSHQSLLHNQAMIRKAFRQTEDSVIVGWLPLYHDMGLIGNVLQSLFVGARCILMSPMAFLQRPSRWLGAISRYRATTSGGPNFAYDLCVRKTSVEQRELLNLSSWTTAFNGAEPVRARTLELFAATFEGCGFRREAFHPCYGLAEATLLVSSAPSASVLAVKRFTADSLHRDLAIEALDGESAMALVGCGKALPDEQIVIVNPDSLTRCEPGRTGEIWVRSASVADGYWNRPEETKQTFEAYIADTGEGPFLRTGDLGFIHDGELFITGRLKDLIIIRGLNHYPQDIELAVETSDIALRPGCGAAFSIDVAGEERLVIAQEAGARRLADSEGLLSTIREAVALQREVQPYAIVLLKPGSIPKTSSGKVQRHACRAKYLEGSLEIIAGWCEAKPSEDGAPLSSVGDQAQSSEAVEEWLVAQLAAKLGLPRGKIDVNRSIVSYGLDSLAATELMHNVETELATTLPVANFLADLSIAQLADRLRVQPRENLSKEKPPASVRIGEEISSYPLSYGQQTLWFLHQLAPESPAYNIAVPLLTSGPLNVEALRRAFQSLVERHSCLRTTFSAAADGPAQHVHKNLGPSFRQQNVAGWSEERVNSYLVEESYRPFDLERDPPLRINLLERSTEQHILLVVVHHIVADFWSLSVIMHELGELYGAERTHRPFNLAPLSQHYSDFVGWQREMLDGPEGDRLRAYWQNHLTAQSLTLNLPVDRQRPAAQIFNGSAQVNFINEELTQRLRALSQSHGATLYMTLLAAFQVMLYRYTGQKRFFIGSPTSGRSRAEWAQIVGYFVNPLALGADFTENLTFAEYLAEARQNMLAALEHQHYPLGVLVESLRNEREVSRPQLFQVMFALQKAHLFGQESLAVLSLPAETGAHAELEDLRLEPITLPQQVAQFDLTLMVVHTKKGLVACLQYNTDLFDRDRITRMLEHYRALLDEIVARPEQRVSDFSILPTAERRQQLLEWNQTRFDHTNQCAHHLFEGQAKKTPDALALAHWQERLTFGELNRRANQLAHSLRRLGVRAEAPVAICMGRSPEMVVGQLGVLKAGGFYIPLDPTYPKQRLEFMLADSGACVLLTNKNLADRLDPSGISIVDLDHDWPSIARESGADFADEIEPDNLAYMIYTSGSTGLPKGVGIHHAGLTNLIAWHQRTYGITARDKATLLASPAFDASVWELWPYLTAGASIHIVEDAVRASVEDLWKWLINEGVTVSFLPTPLAEVMLDEGFSIDRVSLRALLVGGDKLSRAPRRPLRGLNGPSPGEQTPREHRTR